MVGVIVVDSIDVIVVCSVILVIVEDLMSICWWVDSIECEGRFLVLVFVLGMLGMGMGGLIVLVVNVFDILDINVDGNC